MASGNVTLYFHTVRRRKPLMEKNADYSVDPTVQTSKDFISYLEDEWQRKNCGSDSYFNELYVSERTEVDPNLFLNPNNARRRKPQRSQSVPEGRKLGTTPRQKTV